MTSAAHEESNDLFDGGGELLPVQAHGAAGVTDDFSLAEAYAHQRTVRIVIEPNEVHRNAIAKIELAKRAPAGA